MTAKSSTKRAKRKSTKRRKPAHPRTAEADVPDLRDWPFEPSLRELRRYVPPPRSLHILDQGEEGACTGFGLAAVINQLNQRRGSDVRVSARMLYEMAKRHDEWPGERYAGSSCRGAIQGWYHMGACRESKWRYDADKPGELTVARAKDARSNTIGAYYRIQPRISDFHAALNEAGAVFCSARTHAGWDDPDPKTGIMPFESEEDGGHAFAVVGYNSKGFWVQNSWGKGWGKRGLGLWLYEDWQANLDDAWVFSLALPTPQIWHLPVAGLRNRSDRAERGSPQRGEIAGHFVHLDDGRYKDRGRYWSDARDVRATARLVAANEKKKYRHLLLYAHGGLNSPKASARRIATMKKTWKRNGVYPYHFMYDTGLCEEIRDLIRGRSDVAKGRVGGRTDWLDELIERGTRRVGRALWREMKRDARQPFTDDVGGGAETLAIWLEALADEPDSELRIHLAGHSTGAILLAHLLGRLSELAPDLAPGLRVATCSLFAPAATESLFLSHYLPPLAASGSEFGIDRLEIFNLDDELERRDSVAGIYRKSLLYLVSRAFEEERPAALFGMERTMEPLRERPEVEAVGDRLRVHVSDGTKGKATESRRHTGFDDDPATLNQVLTSILGAPPEHPFTKEILEGED